MPLMTHPDLPGVEIPVSAEQLEHYARSGWVDAYPVLEPEAEAVDDTSETADESDTPPDLEQ